MPITIIIIILFYVFFLLVFVYLFIYIFVDCDILLVDSFSTYIDGRENILWVAEKREKNP